SLAIETVDSRRTCVAPNLQEVIEPHESATRRRNVQTADCSDVTPVSFREPQLHVVVFVYRFIPEARRFLFTPDHQTQAVCNIRRINAEIRRAVSIDVYAQ